MTSILEELDALVKSGTGSDMVHLADKVHYYWPTIRSRLQAAERLAAAADQLEQAVWVGELESEYIYCDLCNGTEGDHDTDCEAGAVVAALIKWNKAKNE